MPQIEEPKTGGWFGRVYRKLLRGDYYISNIGRPSEEDFLVRSYVLNKVRLRNLLRNQLGDRYPDNIPPDLEAMLSLDQLQIDWSDLYALELAVLDYLPEEELDQEYANLRARFYEVTGRPPESVLVSQVVTPSKTNDPKPQEELTTDGSKS